MKKLILILLFIINLVVITLALISLISIVTAQGIREGQIITQQQLNNINVSNINYLDLRCNVNEGYEIDRKYIYKLFDCLEVNQINETHYLIQRERFETKTEIKRIVNCLNRFTVNQCRTGLERDVRRQASQIVEVIKRQIVVYQTPEDPHGSTLRNWMRTLNLFGGG